MRRIAQAGLLIASLSAALPGAPYQDKTARTSLVQAIQSQLALSKFNGLELREAGSVLVVQKDGITAIPGSGVGFTVPSFGNNYRDGKMRRDVISSLASANKPGLRNLAPGEGVYLLKIQATDSNVILDVQSCGACDPAQPEPFPVRATVTFPFRKGFIETTAVETIMGAIGEVFRFPGPATPEPVRIELGQTIEQVQAMLGPPEKIVDLGSKKIYVFKELKVTFLDGVVADVQ